MEKYMILSLIKRLLNKSIYFCNLIFISLFLYFINIKFSYAYINPGIFGMFLQFIVAAIAIIWFYFSRLKILIKSFYKKISKDDNELK